jgi:hypothetical protein
MRQFGRARVQFLITSCFFVICASCLGQSSTSQGPSSPHQKAATTEESKSQHNSANQLGHDFFASIRAGDAKQLLTYVPEGGVNVGSKAVHLTRAEVEDQLTQHTGIYCKLFDSSCIQSEIRLDNSSVRACSYRELLTKSSDVHTAATETTRNGVRQAILVARMKNDNCVGVGLVDFIFNLESDGWKLFSIP